MIERDWYKCYKEGWKGVIVDDAFAHPAKFARGLIRRIYQHAISQGWMAAGDTVVDPFAGVGLGALHAMRHGLHWRGRELEPRFVTLGQQNIDLWNATYAEALPGWGTARLVQGDSRELARVVGEAGAVVSSPPFPDGGAGDQRFGGGLKDKSIIKASKIGGGGLTAYGTTPGQLGAMPAGEFAGAVSSPPFLNAYNEPGNGMPTDNRMGQSEWNLSALPIGEDGSRKGNLQDVLAQGSSDGAATFWTAARAIVTQTHHVLRPGAVAIWVTKAFVRKGQRVDFPGQWLELCQACGFEPLEWVRAWLVEDSGMQRGLFGDDVHLMKERKSFFRRLAEKNARAEELWPSFSRSEQARYIRAAHADLWAHYRYALANPDPDDPEPPTRPTRSRMLRAARMAAYVDAGEPRIEIDTSIDYEVVVIVRKPDGEGAGVGAVVSSPPFSVGDSASGQSLVGRGDKSANWIKANTGWSTDYGTTPGQLANLPEGDHAEAIGGANA